MHIHMHITDIHTVRHRHKCMHICTIHTCTHAKMCTHMYRDTDACTYSYMHADIDAYTHRNRHKSTHTHTHMYSCRHIHAHTHMYSCRDTYTHTHTFPETQIQMHELLHINISFYFIIIAQHNSVSRGVVLSPHPTDPAFVTSMAVKAVPALLA